ncbi:MAG TPA: hypothetical protein VEU08_12990 [Vicinamibacterales bacterium]|nr:hypothetical protein [Vicinamibacterales bacterium]
MIQQAPKDCRWLLCANRGAARNNRAQETCQRSTGCHNLPRADGPPALNVARIVRHAESFYAARAIRPKSRSLRLVGTILEVLQERSRMGLGLGVGELGGEDIIGFELNGRRKGHEFVCGEYTALLENLALGRDARVQHARLLQEHDHERFEGVDAIFDCGHDLPLSEQIQRSLLTRPNSSFVLTMGCASVRLRR